MMYLGPTNKPFHKAECLCDKCAQWMVDEINRLRALVEQPEVTDDAEPVVPGK